MSLLRPMGRIIQFGVAKEKVKAKIPLYEIYRKELSILGSFVNPFTMNRAVHVLLEHEDVFRGIVGNSFSLEESAEILKGNVKTDNFLKAMIRF